MDAVGVLRVGKKHWTIVDLEDFNYLSSFSWAKKSCHKGKYIYAKLDPQSGNTPLHRFILSALPGEFVDHKNGNTLDNRRANLRICNPKENAQNRKVRSDSKTGVKGVTLHKDGFRVRIQVGKQRKCFGPYNTLEKAKQKYIEKSLEFFKEFSFFNRKVG